jgi:hypothetical protein
VLPGLLAGFPSLQREIGLQWINKWKSSLKGQSPPKSMWDYNLGCQFWSKLSFKNFKIARLKAMIFQTAGLLMWNRFPWFAGFLTVGLDRTADRHNML